MFSLSFLSVSLTGASLILLLTAASDAQYFDATQLPDYDYNATFDYSFYSNASSEDLDKFSERFIDQEEREDEGTGGRQEEEEVTVTMVTTQRTTERGEDDVGTSDAQYFDATQLPDYDYNATFDYSFYSNASSEDLDKFSERFIDQEEREDEGTGGRQEEEEVTVTMVTTQRTTERGEDDVGSAASLPVCLEIRTLLWTLMILIGLNTHTL